MVLGKIDNNSNAIAERLATVLRESVASAGATVGEAATALQEAAAPLRSVCAAAQQIALWDQQYRQQLTSIIQTGTPGNQQAISRALQEWRAQQFLNAWQGQAVTPPLPEDSAALLLGIGSREWFGEERSGCHSPLETQIVDNQWVVRNETAMRLAGPNRDGHANNVVVWERVGNDALYSHYLKTETASRFSWTGNTAPITSGKLTDITLHERPDPYSANFVMRAQVADRRIPLPTHVTGGGMPLRVYVPIDPPDARVLWDSTAGQLYLQLPSVPHGPQAVTVQGIFIDHVPHMPQLTPVRFDVTAEPALAQKDQLSPITRRVFEETTDFGDTGRYGPYALTTQEQLEYAAHRLAGLWHYEAEAEGFELLADEGAAALQTFHLPDGVTSADCELASTEFFLAARAFGYNVRRVNGFVCPDATGDLTLPGHAWVEHVDLQSGEYAALEPTPSGVDLSGTITYKLQGIEQIKRGHGFARHMQQMEQRYADIAQHGATPAKARQLLDLAAAYPAQHITPDTDSTIIRGPYLYDTNNYTYIRVFLHDPLGHNQRGKYLGHIDVHGLSNLVKYAILDWGMDLPALRKALRRTAPDAQWQIQIPDEPAASSTLIPEHGTFILPADLTSPAPAPALTGAVRTSNPLGLFTGQIGTLDQYPGQVFTMPLDPITEVVTTYTAPDGATLTLDDLTQLEFEPVQLDDGSTLRFNRDHQILLENPARTLPRFAAALPGDPPLRLAWATSQQRRLIPVASHDLLSQFGGALVDETERLATAAYQALQGRPAETEEQIGLIRSVYYQLLHSPPAMYQGDWNSAITTDAVFWYFIQEAKRLGLNTPEAITAHMTTRNDCGETIDHFYRKPDTCTATVAVTPDELELLALQAMARSKTTYRQYQHRPADWGPHFPNLNHWLDDLAGRLEVKPGKNKANVAIFDLTEQLIVPRPPPGGGNHSGNGL